MEEIGRIQKRSEDSEGRERTRPGFYFEFVFCLCAAVAREGLSRYFMFIWLLKFYLSVGRFPPPSSRNYGVFFIITLVPKPGRKEGRAAEDPLPLG